MEISIKWNICRVCLQEEKKTSKKNESAGDTQLVNLFDENKNLPFLIFELSGISMKPEDSLPDKICNKCLTIVNNAVEFRKTCRSSNSYLRSILERTKSASTLLKPVICTIKNDVQKEEFEATPTFKEDNFEQKLNDEKEKVTDDIKTGNLNVEHHKDEIEEELNDNISDYSVELEEIIEMSDDEQLYTETMADDNDSLSLKSDNITETRSEISQLQKFYMNASFSKQNNTEVDSNNSDKEEEESISEKDMEFILFDEEEKAESEMDESTMTDLEEQINNNEDQALVSSTVDTKEEIEYYEDNSNNSNFSSVSDKSESEKINDAVSHNKRTLDQHFSFEKSKSSEVFSKRKIKTSSLKSATYDSVQVCVCEICGNRFTNQSQMKLHMKIHLQYKNHQCEICFKSFITACNLQAHMRIHTGEKPFECKHCGRRFGDRSSHVRHERTHTNEKPFECFNCGKSFSLATSLRNHMKVHSDERSYRCEPCGKSFKLQHHLKKHQSTTLHRSVLQIADDES